MANKIKSYGRSVNQQGDNLGEMLVFHCPGCGYDHPFNVGGDASKHPQWTWNGSLERPTFSPSLLCNKDHAASRCHSYVTDGKIQFLNDCHHNLKGQTVELPDWDNNK